MDANSARLARDASYETRTQREAPLGLILSAAISPGKETRYDVSVHKPMRVGRSEPSDVVFSDDHSMSRMHFEVSFASGCWRLQDLRSTNGTWLNGKRVDAAVLKPGDVVVAGKRSFTVSFVEQQNTETAPADRQPVVVAPADALMQWLRKCQPLYAIVDSARHPEILSTLLHSKEPYFWLFSGEESARLAQFAPFLVPLPPASPLLEWAVQKGWGNHWGIFLSSPAPSENLCASMRGLLRGILANRTEVLLRFYDPRVLKKVMAATTIRQARMLFDTVQTYIVDGDTPGQVKVFSQVDQGIQTVQIALDGQQPMHRQINAPVKSHIDLLSEFCFPITEEQSKLFKDSEENGMQKELLQDFREHHPREFQAFGPKVMADYVAHGLLQAPRYGLRSYLHMRQYILLMMKLGKTFDTSPSVPWASQLLTMRLKPEEKLTRLNERAKKSGPERTQLVPMIGSSRNG